jgi:hypothetical protein
MSSLNMQFSFSVPPQFRCRSSDDAALGKTRPLVGPNAAVRSQPVEDRDRQAKHRRNRLPDAPPTCVVVRDAEADHDAADAEKERPERGKTRRIEIGQTDQHRVGRSQGAERHGPGMADQSRDHRDDRVEPQSDQQWSADGDRNTESAHTLYERRERPAEHQ